MAADRLSGGEAGGGAPVDAAAIDRLLAVLEEFRRLDPDMPIQYAVSFLTVARAEGLSIGTLAERLGVAQSSASRNVAALGAWHSFRKPGHDLVQAHEDPRERRRKVVTLTDKGRALLARLLTLMGGGPAGQPVVARFEPKPEAGRRRAAGRRAG